MSRKRTTLAGIARAAWRDGFVVAWLVVLGISLFVGATTPRQWLLGALFGAQVGLAGGYLVTVQRNYRRARRENLEWELARMKQLRLRTIARQPRPSVDRDDLLAHLNESERQLRESLEALS